MRLEDGDTMVIDAADMTAYLADRMRAYYHFKGRIAAKVVVEIPYKAWEPRTMISCEVDYYNAEFEPPEAWFIAANVRQSMPEDEPTPPMKKLHADEMIVVRKTITGADPEPGSHMDMPDRAGQSGSNGIETIPGNITEDITLAKESDPDAEVIEQAHTDTPASDASGLERTAELDRATKSIDTADSPESEHDGNE